MQSVGRSIQNVMLVMQPARKKTTSKSSGKAAGNGRPPRPPVQPPPKSHADSMQAAGPSVQAPVAEEPKRKRMTLAQLPKEVRYGAHALTSIAALLQQQTAAAQAAVTQRSIEIASAAGERLRSAIQADMCTMLPDLQLLTQVCSECCNCRWTVSLACNQHS